MSVWVCLSYDWLATCHECTPPLAQWPPEIGSWWMDGWLKVLTWFYLLQSLTYRIIQSTKLLYKWNILLPLCRARCINKGVAACIEVFYCVLIFTLCKDFEHFKVQHHWFSLRTQMLSYTKSPSRVSHQNNSKKLYLRCWGLNNKVVQMTVSIQDFRESSIGLLESWQYRS